MDFAAVIVAAGAGVRAGGDLPKQWRRLAGKPVLRWSAEALLAAGAAPLVVVIPAGDEARASEALAGLYGWTTTAGGPTRALSVQRGLAAVGGDAARPVLVHDAARPLVAPRHVADLLAALEAADGALPALPVADTLKRQGDGMVSTASRDGLWRAQTPQAFRLQSLRDAYAAWTDAAEPTDDAQVMEAAGGRIVLTPGDAVLMKLTHAEDWSMAEVLAGGARIVRVGQGFDAHRFGPGDGVWLCGVEIAHDQALVGHSDADAGLHALTDAVLGAIGQGDIGDHFLPGDPQWKGASSDRFLLHAMELLTAGGGRLLSADVTLICEAPKIKPHREAMRLRLAELLAVPLDRISVKATTTEGMGFTGRREGLAAQAIVSVETPS